MMINYVTGNLFDSEAQALVNTVNCVGVMGKGIAHQFKRAYPQMFKAYRQHCKNGEVRLGEVMLYKERDKIIINFPTKGHWRSSSRLADIEAGLESLKALIAEHEIQSLAIPPLGCGNGGLKWPDVRDAIAGALGDIDARIDVYPPRGHFESRVAKEPKLAPSHYVLAELRNGLASGQGRLALQKAAYFFNVATGEDYFRFEQHKFGPYCVAIEPMALQIRDYLDWSKLDRMELIKDGLQRKLAGDDADRLEGWLATIHATSMFCRANAPKLEAFATAHAVVRNGAATEEQIVEKFLGWSEEKSERFTASDVRATLSELESLGLVERTLYGFAVVPMPQVLRANEQVCLRLTADESARLDRYAMAKGLSREDVFRTAIDQILRQDTSTPNE
jgi:O-acetyl-ADP-ribose deacetylase (regulator of RNase III)/uncharacterized protein YwgA